MRRPMTWHTILVLGAVVLIAGALVKTTGTWIPFEKDAKPVSVQTIVKETPMISEEEYRKNIDLALADVWQALKTGGGTDELFSRVQKSVLDLKVPTADKDWHLKLVLALNSLVKAAKGEGSLTDAGFAFQSLFTPSD